MRSHLSNTIGLRLSHSLAVVGLVAMGALTACADDQPPPKTAYETPSVTQVTNAPAPAPAPPPQTDQTLNVGPNLRKACGIDDVSRAPKFDFDKANLSSNDRDIASQIATCLTSGPLKGRSVSLVGRADPRGTEAYNLNLGEKRADAVKAYLIDLGVEPSRLSGSSRGALDATGTNEETWRSDRRVDIELAD
jgi:peptidoglycan-associated lipoprotein